VKNFAKQAFLFIISFFIIFLAATGIKFLSLQVEWAKNLPPKPETSLTLLIAAAHWALSLSLFSSVLFSLSYSARKNYSSLMTIICVMGLSILFCFGFSSILDNWKYVPPTSINSISLGDKGVILSNSLNNREGTAVVLLGGTAQPLGPRVTAIPRQPLIYQETASASFTLPPVPFTDDTPWFLKSLSIDIRLNAENLQSKYNEGLLPFFIYAGSLIFLLCSLGHTIRFSAWPLANLFLSILAFGGILVFESFINTPEMQYVIDSFLRGMVPSAYSVPLIFLCAGLLLYIYSFLVFIIKRRDADEY